ncbi:hypothetical protein Tco_0128636 [Tanacetum coccineum]
MLRQWVCFHDHKRRTLKGSCMGFAYFLQVHYGNQRIDDTTRERRYYEWVAQNYKFDNNRTPSTTVSDKCPYKTNYPTPILPDEWDTSYYLYRFQQPGCNFQDRLALRDSYESELVGYPFDYRVTMGFGSIAGGLDHVNPDIRLPLEHGISRVLGLDDYSNLSVGTNPVTASITLYT